MSTQDDQHSTMVVTSVRLPEDTIAELERYAPRHRNGRSALIRQGIDELLDRLRTDEEQVA